MSEKLNELLNKMPNNWALAKGEKLSGNPTFAMVRYSPEESLHETISDSAEECLTKYNEWAKRQRQEWVNGTFPEYTKGIVLSFTLKGQPEESILEIVRQVAEDYPGRVLIHGFLPKAVVVEKGFSTSVVDALAKFFPVQLNMWNEKPLREEMVAVAKQMDAKIIVIGDIKEGVAEEIELYTAAGLSHTQIPLPLLHQ